MSPLLKNLIIALSITVLLGIVYMFTIGSSDDEFQSDGEASTLSDSEIAQKTEAILSNTQELNGYLENTTIFTDKRFTTLKDFRVEIQDVATGRSNPFEPVQ